MKKSGAKHSRLAVIPLNAKTTRNEMSNRAALTALMAGCATQQHVVDLYVLADLCETLNTGKTPHIETHVMSIKRLCNELHDRNYQASTIQAMAMTASVNILIDWMGGLTNKKIADVATRKMQRILRQ